eukprot:CAMPEP_0197627826 /NCGR_PEP_ID=MMETSP1338-20131121/6332_1 /TAXON_ID=43686 ORGANISM="Pelagodinium beii, Strain RCC1491" /NCGR_SAMPLE_ID=MMETSP1338 /ASSEMBLY_ACC=CAM_ASM_000754 /LENGTH=363 /DNA_ID=CAMNT_0043198653 /DNA_START=49 /DNA_END=1140 /DNA_ORIENTATION=+
MSSYLSFSSVQSNFSFFFGVEQSQQEDLSDFTTSAGSLQTEAHGLPEDGRQRESLKKIESPERICSTSAREIAEACSVCQLERAMKIADSLGTDSFSDTRDAVPWLDKLPCRVERVHRVLEACMPPSSPEWKRFDLESVEGGCFWRCWDARTGNLKTIISWVAPGSLEKVIAYYRDAAEAEPLWQGECWGMRCQHADGISFQRWLQKEYFTARTTEVLVERCLCDCLDHSRPCWVLLERSPDVPNLSDFAGTCGNFEISPCPGGAYRTVMEESGRVLEPLTPDTVRTTMALSVHVPGLMRWALTDSLLHWGFEKGTKSSTKSWMHIIDNWDSSGYPRRIQDSKDFYEPVHDRISSLWKSSLIR